MDETRFAAKFLKNENELVTFGMNRWQEKWRCFIRIYYPDPEKTQEWLPTKKGISLTTAQFPALQEALVSLGEDLLTDRIVGVLAKNESQEIRISLGKFKNIKLIDIRTFIKIDGEFRATQKGISLKTELYPQLMEGVEQMAGMISESVTW